MKIKDIMEMTSSGSVASVAMPLGKTNRRGDQGVYRKKTDEAYPDNFSGIPSDNEPSEREKNEVHSELVYLAKQGVREFMKMGRLSTELDPRNAQEFKAAVEHIVDNNVYAEMNSRYEGWYEWEEMEHVVEKILVKAMKNG